MLSPRTLTNTLRAASFAATSGPKPPRRLRPTMCPARCSSGGTSRVSARAPLATRSVSARSVSCTSATPHASNCRSATFAIGTRTKLLRSPTSKRRAPGW